MNGRVLGNNHIVVQIASQTRSSLSPESKGQEVPLDRKDRLMRKSYPSIQDHRHFIGSEEGHEELLKNKVACSIAELKSTNGESSPSIAQTLEEILLKVAEVPGQTTVLPSTDEGPACCIQGLRCTPAPSYVEDDKTISGDQPIDPSSSHRSTEMISSTSSSHVVNGRKMHGDQHIDSSSFQRSPEMVSSSSTSHVVNGRKMHGDQAIGPFLSQRSPEMMLSTSPSHVHSSRMMSGDHSIDPSSSQRTPLMSATSSINMENGSKTRKGPSYGPDGYISPQTPPCTFPNEFGRGRALTNVPNSLPPKRPVSVGHGSGVVGFGRVIADRTCKASDHINGSPSMILFDNNGTQTQPEKSSVNHLQSPVEDRSSDKLLELQALEMTLKKIQLENKCLQIKTKENKRSSALYSDHERMKLEQEVHLKEVKYQREREMIASRNAEQELLYEREKLSVGFDSDLQQELDLELQIEVAKNDIKLAEMTNELQLLYRCLDNWQ